MSCKLIIDFARVTEERRRFFQVADPFTAEFECCHTAHADNSNVHLHIAGAFILRPPNEAQIYGGKFVDGGPNDPQGDVVMKVVPERYKAKAASLKKEYSFYSNQLSHLQGKHVPHCYGLFRGKLYGKRVYCLLLEYVGLPEGNGLLNMTMDERYASVAAH